MKRYVTSLLVVALLSGCTSQQLANLKSDAAVLVADARTGATIMLGLVNAAESNAATWEEIAAAIDAYTQAPGSDKGLTAKLKAALASKDLYTLKALLVIAVGTPPAQGSGQ